MKYFLITYHGDNDKRYSEADLLVDLVTDFQVAKQSIDYDCEINDTNWVDYRITQVEIEV